MFVRLTRLCGILGVKGLNGVSTRGYWLSVRRQMTRSVHSEPIRVRPRMWVGGAAGPIGRMFVSWHVGARRSVAAPRAAIASCAGSCAIQFHDSRGPMRSLALRLREPVALRIEGDGDGGGVA